jgi:hypothetical protein
MTRPQRTSVRGNANERLLVGPPAHSLAANSGDFRDLPIYRTRFPNPKAF